MIIGTYANGEKCAYDVPKEIETATEFESLITGYSWNPAHREELHGQPKLKGFAGPMFGGFGNLKSTGEQVVIIRYEK